MCNRERGRKGEIENRKQEGRKERKERSMEAENIEGQELGVHEDREKKERKGKGGRKGENERERSKPSVLMQAPSYVYYSWNVLIYQDSTGNIAEQEIYIK